MLKEFKADFHIHTCLSRCSTLDMFPRNIVKTAKEKELDFIAITDHNSLENALATRKLAKDLGIAVLLGMEISSQEEVHFLSLFEDIDNALKMQEIVYNALPEERITAEEQVIVNELDEVDGFCDRMLFSSVSLSLRKLVEKTKELNGLAIASHIDRESFSVIGTLGFIPPNIQFDALEISSNMPIQKAHSLYSEYSHIPMITSSDAHFVNDIGKVYTRFLLEEPTIAEIKLALKGVDGRKIVY